MNMIRLVSKSKKKMINGVPGMISIMLAIMILPFFSVAAVLVEAERYQSAVSLLDEAMGSASFSVLADYDKYAFDRFGIMSVSPKVDVDSAYKDYFEYNTENISNSTEYKSLLAEGKYPLSELSVLTQQIQEYGKLNVPMTLADEALHLSELIAALDKLTGVTNILSTITSTAKTVDGLKKIKSDIEKLKKEAKDMDDLREKYDSKFAELQNAVEDLIAELAEDEPDEEKISEAMGKVKTIRDEYEQLCHDIADQVIAIRDARDKLDADLTAEIQNVSNTVNNAIHIPSDIDGTAISRLQDQIDNSTDFEEITRLTQEKNALEQQKAEHDLGGSMSSAVNDGIGSLLVTAKENVQNFDGLVADTIVGQFREQANIAANLDPNSVTKDSETPREEDFHYADTSLIPTEEEVQEIIDELEEHAVSSGLMSLLQGLVDVIQSLFSTELFYDLDCTAVLDANFYQTSIGGLPSETTVGTTDYFSEMLRNLGDFFVAVGSLGADAAGLKIFKMIDDICKAVDSMVKFVDNLINLIGQMVSRIMEIFGGNFDSVFMMTYFAYNLPNRTNYDGGSTMSGYGFGNIERGTPTVADFTDMSTVQAAINVLQGTVDSGSDKMFHGAELEYIFFGSKSEKINQTVAFFAVYFVRLALDVLPVVSNKEVQAMSKIPYVGPVFLVLIVLGEPFIDTVFLVNGEKETIIKKTIYLTPSGLDDLIKKAVHFSSPALKSKVGSIQTKLSDKFSTGGIEKNPSASFASGLLEFDYTAHMFALMMLLGNEDAYTMRLADLIQTDCYVYWNHKDLSTQYNIHHAYTYVRSSAEVGFNTLLPLSKLSKDSFFDVKREIFRGY
jgi:hypothetical protein